MKTEDVHTLILGAGPAGLAAAYRLAKAGVVPVVVEKSHVAGGLMRSVRRGAFSVDLGRKELYSRIPDVDRLWTEVLGDAYRPYPHRVGVLYHNRIFEIERQYRGFRRGVPWPMFFLGVLDYLWYAIKFRMRDPHNYEAYRYRRRGRRFTRMFAQGFSEKFEGIRWAEMPPEEAVGVKQATLIEVAFAQGTAAATTHATSWRHPAKGSGQISQLLEQHICEAGGSFQFGAQVSAIHVSDGRITHVHVETEDGKLVFQPQHVVSSLPLEALCQFVLPNALGTDPQNVTGTTPVRKSTILVYLFSAAPPKFPHAWLHVTCPTTRIGRITNYAAFNGEMVPEGQTCLCLEFFCTGSDPLLDLDAEALYALALEECVKFGLVDPATCLDHLVIKLPGADAATKWQDWLTDTRRQLLTAIQLFENLYNVNRPGMDKAAYAGLQAAEAILTSNRIAFNRLTDLLSGGFLE
jgi:protoporphyrinogen oxidase